MGVQELAVVGLVGSGVGAALGLPMVWARPTRVSDPRVLGLGMLLMSAIAALISARLAGVVPGSVAIEHAINLVGLTAFPVAVYYARLALGVGHGRPWAAALAAPAVAYLTWVVGRGLLGLESRVAFVWLLPVALTFTGAGVVSLWRGRRQSRVADALVPPEWVVGFLVLVNAAQIVRLHLGHVPAVRAVVPLVLAGGFVAMVASVAWRLATTARSASEPIAAAKYERSSLDEPAARALLARVEHALDADRLFARADLTLSALAGAVGATPHQVSEALNRFRGVTFHEVVNRRRVDDVKAQLADAGSDRFTIEGIGASAGFGSRSALYAAFQKFEGMTPTAFRAAQRALTPAT